MSSTLIRTAVPSVPAVTCAPAVDRLVLPAAVAAPSALVIAVEQWLSQETSVLSGLVAGSTGDVAPHAYATSLVAAAKPAFRTRMNDVQGSPPRGTPV